MPCPFFYANMPVSFQSGLAQQCFLVIRNHDIQLIETGAGGKGKININVGFVPIPYAPKLPVGIVELHVNKRLTSAVNINRPSDDLSQLKQRTKKFLRYYNSYYAT